MSKPDKGAVFGPVPPAAAAEKPAVPKGIKRCPACAEYTRAEAVVCRTCSYDWRTGWLVNTHRTTNGLAVTSLVLAVLSLLAFALVPIALVGGILAVSLGIAARRQIASSQGLQGGREMATAGLVLGWVALGVALVLGIIFLLTGVETITVDISGI